MKSTVFEFKIDGLLSVRITGSNENRYSRYCARIGKAADSEDAKVDYTASAVGNWALEGTAEPNQSVAFKGRPVFYESTYQVRCQFDENASVTDAFVFHEMSSVADEFYYESNLLDGRLDFVNAPGRFRFEIRYVSHGHAQSLVLTWVVVSEKIDVVTDAREIKEKIEKESSGFVYWFLSPTKEKAGPSLKKLENGGEWLDIFRHFCEPYIAAVEYVIHSPHLRYTPEIEYMRADRVKRWTAQMANRFACMDRDRQESSLFRVERIQPRVDTLENRFVKYTVCKIGERLGLLCGQCKNAQGVATRYADEVAKWQGRVEKLAGHPFFRSIGKFSGFKQENLVLQRRQGYAKILETWVTLQHAIDVSREGLEAGNRPIWKLYEFWCYLMIRDYLRDVCKYEEDKEKSGLGSVGKVNDIFLDEDPELADGESAGKHEKGGKKCSFYFKDAVGKRTIELTYQQSYSNVPSVADQDDSVAAHIVEQIPDIVMSIREDEGEKNVFTYLFDAKYQIMSWPTVSRPEKDAAPFKTINEMHRYRDAILYRKQKSAGESKGKLTHEIIGAYVLYPGRYDKSFDYEPYINEENVGAIPLLPGDDGVKILHKYLKRFLDHKNAVAHLKDVLPTRGTSVVVGELPDEKSLVNVHWDEEKAEDIFAYACYRKVVPVEKELLSGMDPAAVRSLRISVGGRAVAVVTGVTQFMGIGLEKSPNEFGDVGWETRLNPAKRYCLFEAKGLPSAPNWVNDSY